MDFRLTSEQAAIQKAAGEFARGEFDRDLALELERAHSFPEDLWKKACS